MASYVHTQKTGEHFRYATPELELNFDPEASLHGGPFPIQCQKDPDHNGFLSLNDLCTEQLPAPFADNVVVETIKALADLTVRIRVKCVSDERPATFPGTTMPYPFHIPGGGQFSRVGSGFVNPGLQNNSIGVTHVTPTGNDTEMNQVCDCDQCQQSTIPMTDWYEIQIMTALHVIYDKKECQDAIIDFFYDDDNLTYRRDHVVSLKGHGCSLPCFQYMDRSCFVCRTHNVQLVERLTFAWNRVHLDLFEKLQSKFGHRDERRDENEKVANPVLIISHPHGCRKYVTVGIVCSALRPSVDYSAKTCPGSSGGLVCVFGGPLLYSIHPHGHSKDGGINGSGWCAAARMNPRFLYS